MISWTLVGVFATSTILLSIFISWRTYCQKKSSHETTDAEPEYIDNIFPAGKQDVNDELNCYRSTSIAAWSLKCIIISKHIFRLFQQLTEPTSIWTPLSTFMWHSDSDKAKTFSECRYDNYHRFNFYDTIELSCSLISTMSNLYFWYSS